MGWKATGEPSVRQQRGKWVIPHIDAGLGAIPLADLSREDVAEWIERLADGGRLSRRSVQICRTVLRAALSEAVEEGMLARSPAARVALPRTVAKPVVVKETLAWDRDQVSRFLEVSGSHRWAVGFRLGVLYGLRRSEVLALRWDDLDAEARTVRIDESVVATNSGAAWGEAKNQRSRRRVPVDDQTWAVLQRRRREQAAERLGSGSAREDHELVIATRQGRLVLPRSHDRALALLVEAAGLPRLTSHGLRHTAATNMVAEAVDVGELRAIADILGHSPETLMNTYAHAVPRSTNAIVDRIGSRS